MFFVAGWFVLCGARRDATAAIAIALIATTVVACARRHGLHADDSDPADRRLSRCIWFFAGELRTALIGNIMLAFGVGVGFLFSLGTSAQNLEQTAITVAISLGLSLALGLWFTRVVRPGARNASASSRSSRRRRRSSPR